MTKDELEAMLPIINEIDGGCSVCVRSYMNGFNELGNEYLLWWSDREYSPVAIYDGNEYSVNFDEYGDTDGIKHNESGKVLDSDTTAYVPEPYEGKPMTIDERMDAARAVIDGPTPLLTMLRKKYDN